MNSAFPNLFSPIRIGPFTLKNRIAVSPHGPMYAVEGVITQRYIDYEVEKAKGGAGLVIMSFGLADPEAAEQEEPTWRALVATWSRDNIPLFRQIVEGVHAQDCRLFFQFGESTYRTRLAPSAFPHSGITGHSSREMSHDDIKRMMDNFALCAANLKEAGLDGIEMHGHGDLFSDFFSPAINRRTDAYGGSRENRTRFFLEAADTIRGVIGREMVLGARVSVDDCIPGSLPLEEGVEIARLLADSGRLDYLNIDTTIEPQLVPQMIAPMYVEPGHLVYAAQAVKAVVTDIPVFTIGRITTPELAEQVIAEGRADVVAMARALIADPELPNKAREGRTDDIRPCLGDNQECIARVNRGLPMGCTVNPAAGRETAWGIGRIAPAARRRKIVVVGGGPAGMEAARVAASRGHEVLLYDKGESLGGMVNLARLLPGRADIGRFIPWQIGQLEKLGVTMRLGVEATRATIAAEAPEILVLATGSIWQASGFNALTFQETPGWEGRALSLTDVVSGRAEPGQRVLVYDLKGFTEAPGVAELLAQRGRQVELVTPLPKLGMGDLDLSGQTGYIMARLHAAGVRLTPDTMVAAIEDAAVTLVNVHSGETRNQAVDDVVIVAGRTPDDALADDLADLDLGVHRIGDCAGPVNIGNAFRQGFELGVRL